MESALSLLDGDVQTVPQDFQISVVGKLEIVDASHNTGQVIVRRVWRLAWLADHGEHGCKALETCPRKLAISKRSFKPIHTSNGELGAASDELQKVAALSWSQLAHCLK